MHGSDPVNRLNRAALLLFTQDMNRLKPSNPRDANYADMVRAWQRAYAFPQSLMHQINDLNNIIILKGKPNISK